MLAEKMGSKIEIISEPDKGSTFYFTIETEFEIGDKPDATSLLDVKRVLVIDDNGNNRLILEHTFNSWKIAFTGIDNGRDAVKIISQSDPFDAIIVDYNMPEMSGMDTIRMIREDLHLSPEALPIILLHSSSDDAEIVEDCKKLGVRFNLVKPVKSQELLNYLRNLRIQPGPETKVTKTLTYNKTIDTSDRPTPIILVTEDVTMNMLLVTTLIRQIAPGSEILQAKNGKEAFSVVTRKHPSLIFMDIQMPEMDGLEATLAIRKHEQGTNSHIPIIALTAGAIKGEEEKCREVGMDDFLTKPIAHDALFHILEKYLSVPLSDLNHKNME
jgi:CheY-like chemotaxis protein